VDEPRDGDEPVREDEGASSGHESSNEHREAGSRGPDGGAYEVGPPGAPTPRIDAGGLLEGFDEDADFERDPEVERALGIEPPPAHAASRAGDHYRADPTKWMVQPGWPGTGMSFWAGSVLCLVAAVMGGIAAERSLLVALSVVFACWIHTGTGVLGALAASIFSERGMNHPERIAARMFAASSAFHLVMLVELPIPTHAVEFGFAVGAYAGAVALQFRLPRHETALLMLSHFGLWAVVEMGVSVRAVLAGG